MTTRSLRNLFISSLVCAVIACDQSVLGNTIFWLQTTDVPGTPAPLQLLNAPGAAGTLYLFGLSDTERVGGFGFDIVSSNPAALSFTAPASNGPQNSTAWDVSNPGTVAAGSVKNIYGFTIGIVGTGFGPGSSI
jgi:hypothetical protein